MEILKRTCGCTSHPLMSNAHTCGLEGSKACIGRTCSQALLHSHVALLMRCGDHCVRIRVPSNSASERMSTVAGPPGGQDLCVSWWWKAPEGYQGGRDRRGLSGLPLPPTSTPAPTGTCSTIAIFVFGAFYIPGLLLVPWIAVTSRHVRLGRTVAASATLRPWARRHGAPRLHRLPHLR